VAMNRPKNVAEGAKPNETVLDILFPCCGRVDRRVLLSDRI
jgi:hypothetical protein